MFRACSKFEHVLACATSHSPSAYLLVHFLLGAELRMTSEFLLGQSVAELWFENCLN